MKRILNLLQVFIIGSFLVLSCDKINEPYINESNQNNNTSNNNNNTDTTDTTPVDTGHVYLQKILIEDFTGHECINCPRGHRTIDDLVDYYGDVIVPISIHSGYYSVPNPAASSFYYDFRCDVGIELGGDGEVDMSGYYGIFSWPIGLVQTLDGSRKCGNGQWSDSVVARDPLNTDPTLGLWIENTYNDVFNGVSTTIETEFLSDFAEDLYIVIYLTEDNIINWQKDADASPTEVEDYLHRHVLRGSFNGTWGELLTSGNQTGEIITTTKNLTLGADWVPENCSVVAFIYSDADKRVINVEEKHIIGH